MPYTLGSGAGSTVISVTAKSREELVRDVVASLLQAAYDGAEAPGPAEGQMVPIQAAGDADAGLLAELVSGTLRAARETPGRLLPPRWIAFDEKRVTATLPVAGAAPPFRALSLKEAVVERPLPEFVGRIELTSGAGS